MLSASYFGGPPKDIAATGFGRMCRAEPIQGFFLGGWDRIICLSKLLFETGCADVSVTAEWAAGLLSAGIAFS